MLYGVKIHSLLKVQFIVWMIAQVYSRGSVRTFQKKERSSPSRIAMSADDVTYFRYFYMIQSEVNVELQCTNYYCPLIDLVQLIC